jgi:alkylhydroperoxidase family enzyme
VNGCQYCLSAHTYVAGNFAHIADDEIRRNRLGQADNPRTAAAVAFARALMETRGKISEADLKKCARRDSAMRTSSKSSR